jgi:16S rRNA (cytidine1402-2'-O)-methyltransferase
MFEQIVRGPLPDLAAAAAAGDPPRGEIVVVVAPAPPPEAADVAQIDAALTRAMVGQNLKSAVAEVAAALGAPRRLVYGRALALRGDPPE